MKNKTTEQLFLVTEKFQQCFVCNFRGHMVFESREEAKKVVQEKRHVKISDQKVTQVLAGKAVSRDTSVIYSQLSLYRHLI